MDHDSIIGIDISKRSFQLHGATATGVPVLRRKLSRGKVLECLASQPPCLDPVVGGADHRSRLAHSSTVAHIVRSVCWGTSTTTPSGRSIRHAGAGGATRTGTNAGAASVDSLSNPRRLSLRWARYSELDDSPFAAA